MPRLHTFMEPFVETLCGQALHRSMPVPMFVACCRTWNAKTWNRSRIVLAKTACHCNASLAGPTGMIPPFRQAWMHQVADHLGQDDGVLVFDPVRLCEIGDRVGGRGPAVVWPLGKVDNCQVALYLGYVSAKATP